MKKIVVCILCQRDIKSKAALQLEDGNWVCGDIGTRAHETCMAEIKRAMAIAWRVAEEKKKKGA